MLWLRLQIELFFKEWLYFYSVTFLNTSAKVLYFSLNVSFLEETSLFLNSGHKVKMIKTNEPNPKITWKEDLELIDG